MRLLTVFTTHSCHDVQQQALEDRFTNDPKSQFHRYRLDSFLITPIQVPYIVTKTKIILVMCICLICLTTVICVVMHRIVMIRTAENTAIH